jgi:hypothetical protein
MASPPEATRSPQRPLTPLGTEHMATAARDLPPPSPSASPAPGARAPDDDTAPVRGVKMLFLL